MNAQPASLATFCPTCDQPSVLLDNGVCPWCMTNPETGAPDVAMQRREHRTLIVQRSRERKRTQYVAGLAKPQTKSSRTANPRKVEAVRQTTKG